MSDRVCPQCGTSLAPSWANRGGHQEGSTRCKIEKSAREMTAIDYCYVIGQTGTELRDLGVPVKYGYVATNRNLVDVKATMGTFVPKYAAYIHRSTSPDIDLKRAIERAQADADFQAAIITIYELAGNSSASMKAVFEYLKEEGLI